MPDLLLKRIGRRGEEHYDVLADDTVVGRIMMFADTPAGKPWMWSLAYGQHEDRTPTHGYEPTREAAMQAFARSWNRDRSTRRGKALSEVAKQQVPTPKPSQKTFRRQHAPSVRKFRSCTLLDGSRTAWELRVSPCLPNGPASARCLASQCCNRSI